MASESSIYTCRASRKTPFLKVEKLDDAGWKVNHDHPKFYMAMVFRRKFRTSVGACNMLHNVIVASSLVSIFMIIWVCVGRP